MPHPEKQRRRLMKTLRGKNAYIVGGSSGIGLAAAKLLFGHGADITIFARDANKLDRAPREIAAQRVAAKQTVAWMPMDVISRRKGYGWRRQASPEARSALRMEDRKHPFHTVVSELFFSGMRQIYGRFSSAFEDLVEAAAVDCHRLPHSGRPARCIKLLNCASFSGS